MSFLRNVLHDLVEKRLWPVAAALLVALVAIPVVLGGGGEDADPASAPVNLPKATAAVADSTQAQVVSVEGREVGRVTRAGKQKNPFKQLHVPKSADPAQLQQQAQELVDAARQGLGGGSGSAGATEPSGGATPTPKAPKKDTIDADDLIRLKLTFGKAGEEKTYENVARLTPFPSSASAFLIFLGMKDDGETAMFLVSSDVVPSGDGKCRPKAESCETLELKKGDSEFLDVTADDGTVVQYQITIKAIAKKSASSKAVAAKVRARESKAGRSALRARLASDPDLLEGWAFSTDLGVLIERPDELRQDDVAHLPEGVDTAAAPAAAEFSAGATP